MWQRAFFGDDITAVLVVGVDFVADRLRSGEVLTQVVVGFGLGMGPVLLTGRWIPKCGLGITPY